MPGPELIRAVLPSPLGDMVVLSDAAGILHGLDFASEDGRLERLAARYWPGARIVDGAAPAPVVRALEAYFAGDPRALDDLPVAEAGTDFQRRTWAALRTIPAGAAWTYADLARAVGRPAAVRAVGQANGANPVSLVQPCHRVVATGGGLGGYAGGLERKAWLLAHEGAGLQVS
ncbi:MAG: methylated-DNA--[protein]-cysteine S-methyltransferase [Phenylobacterium sp.]